MVREIINEFTDIFPDAPYCIDHIKDFNFSIPIPVTLWMLNQKILYDSGIIVWKEKLITSCYSNFFGTCDTNIISRSLENIPDDMYFPEIFKDLSVDEIIDLNNEDPYFCKWLTTQTKTTIRLKAKKIKFFKNPSGRPKLDGNWEKDKTIKNLWRSEYRIIKIKNDINNKCPLIKDKSELAIMNFDDDTMFITLPILKMQFTIHINKLNPTCKIEDDIIYETDGHYYISWNQELYKKLIIKYNKTLITNTLFNKPFQDIQPLKLPSEITYRLNKLVDYTNENLQDIVINLCRYRQLIWSFLSPPFLETKVAKFLSQNPFSPGTVKDNLFTILIPSDPHELEIMIPEDKSMINGKLKIIHNGLTKYIEPISGIITLSPYKWKTSYHSTWLPLSNSHRYEYYSGRIYKGNTPKDSFEKMKKFSGFNEIERIDSGFIKNLDFSEDSNIPKHIKENILESIWNDWSTKWTFIKTLIIIFSLFVFSLFLIKIFKCIFIKLPFQ